jgi:hypothetical protein
VAIHQFIRPAPDLEQHLLRGALLNALITIGTITHETDIGTIRVHLLSLRDSIREALTIVEMVG